MAEAIRHGEQAIETNPNDARSLQLLARLLTTIRQETFRDTQKAVAYAKRAAELTGYQDAGPLDALAAAHAAAGEFGEAAQWQEKALSLVPASAKAKCRARLERYRAGKP